MDRQELIDKAVETLEGKVPRIEGGSLYLTCYDDYAWCEYGCIPSLSAVVVCTLGEFEKRAKELGWINGYQYGVEYETNGEKPDLPTESLKLAIRNRHLDLLVQYCDSNFVKWENVKSFRIVDERFKPKETSNNTLKKGTPVQFPSGEGVMLVAEPDNIGVVIVQDECGEYRRVAAENIKPIKTEREKFIDIICKHPIYKDAVGKLADDLIHSGFRAPQQDE